MTRKANKILSLVSLLVLMAVVALGMVSCGTKTNDADTGSATDTSVESTVDSAVDSTVDSAVDTDVDVDTDEAKAVTVTIEITDDKGEKTSKEYTSETAKTLADLLKENELVEGDETEYGLMITVVNGLRADYNADGAYWALYKNGDYMMTGADGETLEDGAVYGLVYTKG